MSSAKLQKMHLPRLDFALIFRLKRLLKICAYHICEPEVVLVCILCAYNCLNSDCWFEPIGSFVRVFTVWQAFVSVNCAIDWLLRQDFLLLPTGNTNINIIIAL
jgi:hypothetical protein